MELTQLKAITTIFLALIACTPCVNSQAPDVECATNGQVSRAEGLKIIERVQEEYLKVKDLKAKFSQSSYLAALEQSEGSAGVLWFSKPGKMKWHYSVPEEQIYIVLDQSFYIYQVPDKQVTIDRVSKVLISDLPVSFLMGIGKLKDDFDFAKACHGKVGLILELKPKNKSSESSLEVFYLVVDPKEYFPIGAKVNDVAGNVTTIILREIESNSKHTISELIFSTDFPSGTYIEDNRVKG